MSSNKKKARRASDSKLGTERTRKQLIVHLQVPDDSTPTHFHLRIDSADSPDGKREFLQEQWILNPAHIRKMVPHETGRRGGSAGRRNGKFPKLASFVERQVGRGQGPKDILAQLEGMDVWEREATTGQAPSLEDDAAVPSLSTINRIVRKLKESRSAS